MIWIKLFKSARRSELCNVGNLKDVLYISVSVVQKGKVVIWQYLNNFWLQLEIKQVSYPLVGLPAMLCGRLTSSFHWVIVKLSQSKNSFNANDFLTAHECLYSHTVLSAGKKFWDVLIWNMNWPVIQFIITLSIINYNIRRNEMRITFGI